MKILAWDAAANGWRLVFTARDRSWAEFWTACHPDEVRNGWRIEPV